MKKEKFDRLGFYKNNESAKEILIAEAERLLSGCKKMENEEHIKLLIDLLITINYDVITLTTTARDIYFEEFLKNLKK